MQRKHPVRSRITSKGSSSDLLNVRTMHSFHVVIEKGDILKYKRRGS